MQCTEIFEKNWVAINAMDENGERKYRYIINEGSSRSSKTISLIDCCDLYARENKTKRITAWRDTKKDAKDTILHDTLKRLKATSRYKLNQTFNKTESIFAYSNDSTLEIHGTDDDEKVMGLEQNVTWVNEPYKISKDTFDQLDMRTSDFVFIDWNPKKAHWIDDLKKDKRAIVIHSTFKDNPFCPREQRLKILSYQPVSFCAIVIEKLLTLDEASNYDLIVNPREFSLRQIKELERCRENEDKRSANEFNWQVYGLGLKAEKPHRIFKWQEIGIEAYKTIDGVLSYGCDWGTVDPWGIVEAKYYDGALYLNEQNYLSENEWRNKMVLSEKLQVDAGGDTDEAKEGGIVMWLFDRLGIDKSKRIICDTNRPHKISALRRRGYQAYRAKKGDGSIMDGIDVLSNIKVYYTSTSVNLKYEQENYSWKTDRYGTILDEPEDLDNHLIDPVRYIAQDLMAQGIIKQF